MKKIKRERICNQLYSHYYKNKGEENVAVFLIQKQTVDFYDNTLAPYTDAKENNSEPRMKGGCI